MKFIHKSSLFRSGNANISSKRVAQIREYKEDCFNRQIQLPWTDPNVAVWVCIRLLLAVRDQDTDECNFSVLSERQRPTLGQGKRLFAHVYQCVGVFIPIVGSGEGQVDESSVHRLGV
jgi:hypothetical protein